MNALNAVAAPAGPAGNLAGLAFRVDGDAGAPTAGPSDIEFIAICAACRGSGGIARGTELAQCLRARGGAPHPGLEALIVGGQVFSFEWNHAWWVPMFQFGPQRGPLPRPAVAVVLAELEPVYDGWALALWFTHPNAWLAGQQPLALLDSALPEVVAAARADRFIANL